MRFVFMGLSALFVVFAAVQLNDPDPLAWVCIYGFTAGLCLAGALGRMGPGPPAIWGVLSALGAVVVYTSWDGSSQPMAGGGGFFAEEVVRESFGLGLVAISALGLAGWRRLAADASETE